MTAKIRAGLYEIEHEINSETVVRYCIEKNNGIYQHDAGKWFITSEIVKGREILESDTGTEPFNTKSQAVQATNEMAGNWKKINGLGWCYIGSK